MGDIPAPLQRGSMSTKLWRHWPNRVWEVLASRPGRVRRLHRPVLYLEELECRLNPGSINPAPVLAFTTPAQTLIPGLLSRTINVQVTDANGNPVANETVNLNTGNTGTGTFYGSPGGPALTSVQTDANGNAPFLYEDAAAGPSP